MHCQEPTCASVCLVKALHKTPRGAVVYEPDICMGCRYCVQACPFDVPRFEWGSLTPRVRKCGFCAARLAVGRPNACAEACPTGATIAGEREALLREARARLSAEPAKYVHKIYGEHDAGGTSVLVLSPVRFSRLGLPEGLPGEPLPSPTYRALSEVPAVAAGAGVFLAGLWWLTRRRAEVKQVESLDVAAKGGR
jgi:formate dehydrogenase iron-sulfur subunit